MSDQPNWADRKDRAEHRAAALHNLGWEQGAGAGIWARVISDVLPLFDGASDRFASDTADQETWERLHGAALTLLVAIDQVLAFEARVRSLTGDAELAKARAAFDAVGPRAEALRNLAMHLDEYAVNQGRRQTGRSTPPITERYPATFIYFSGPAAYVGIADDQLSLRSAARAAVRLATTVERVRVTYLERAEREANHAFRKLYNVPDPGAASGS